MLDDLRSVPWYTALALVATGAIVAILLAVLIDGFGGSAGATKRVATVRIGRAVAGKRVGGKARPKLVQEDESPPAEEVSLARMVGQRFMVGLWGALPSPALLEDARKGEIGGVVIFPLDMTPAAVREAAARLQQAAHKGRNPALLIATDQEGGPIKRFSSGPPYKPLSQLSPKTARLEGARTGSYLLGHGINVDLAPVVDLGLPDSFMTAEHRTISEDPSTVASIAAAFSEGLMSRGVMPVPKHFPGLGLAASNTDDGRVVIEGDLGSSLVPYESLIAGRIPAIMVSTATYGQYDSERGAAWAPKIVHGLLRKRLGFRRVVITDSLSSAGVQASLSTSAAVTAAARVGVDMLMVTEPELFPDAHDALLKAAKDGRISPRNLDSSYQRIKYAKERFAP